MNEKSLPDAEHRHGQAAENRQRHDASLERQMRIADAVLGIGGDGQDGQEQERVEQHVEGEARVLHPDRAAGLGHGLGRERPADKQHHQEQPRHPVGQEHVADDLLGHAGADQSRRQAHERQNRAREVGVSPADERNPFAHRRCGGRFAVIAINQVTHGLGLSGMAELVCMARATPLYALEVARGQARDAASACLCNKDTRQADTRDPVLDCSIVERIFAEAAVELQVGEAVRLQQFAGRLRRPSGRRRPRTAPAASSPCPRTRPSGRRSGRRAARRVWISYFVTFRLANW